MPESMPARTVGTLTAGTRLAVLAALALAFAGSLAPGQVLAQAAGPAYQVEILVFGQPAGSSLEKPPRPKGLAPVDAGQAGVEPTPGHRPLDPLRDHEEAPPLPPGFGPPAAPRALDAIAGRLARAGHPVLWHQAWVQPATSREGPELPLLAALGQGRADPGLKGVVTLNAGRFLHLGLALELESSAGLEAVLNQRRRIRLGAEQYFDHPRIGVIAVVTRTTGSGSQGPNEPGL